MSNAPFFYDYANAATSAHQPGSIITGDTTSTIFRRSLLQRAFSIFNFTIPDTWPREFFLYTLFCQGYGVVTNTPKFGTIFQPCGLSGYNLYYQPTTAIIANPLYSAQCTIGKDCEIIKMQPDYCGVLDTVNFYAVKLANLAASIDVNLFNTRLAYVFGVDSEADAATFRALMDEVTAGKTAVMVARKKMFDDQGNLKWQLFTQDVKNVFIVPELIEAFREVMNGFDSEIGIPNMGRKKERMVVDEVSRNDFENQARALLWLQTIRDSFDRVNKMFNLDLSVDLKEGVYNDPASPADPV